MTSENEEIWRRIAHSRDEAQAALEEILMIHRERLIRMARVRLDPRLRDRVDASDVIQEASLEAWQRLDEYLRDPQVSLFVWLRFLTAQKVVALHRKHLGAQRRDVRLEVRMSGRHPPSAKPEGPARQLTGESTPPLAAISREERRVRLLSAFDSLEPLDREVITLRDFEQLSNVETAELLGLEQSAASKRHVRALKRLRNILGERSRAGRERDIPGNP
jgi:RNA polymerase sigma-70 factor (ECF subfamily)